MICGDCAKAADAKLLTGHCGSQGGPSASCTCQHRPPGTGQRSPLPEAAAPGPYPIIMGLGMPLPTGA